MDQDSDEISKNKNSCFIHLFVFWMFFLIFKFFPLMFLQYTSNLGTKFLKLDAFKNNTITAWDKALSTTGVQTCLGISGRLVFRLPRGDLHNGFGRKTAEKCGHHWGRGLARLLFSPFALPQWPSQCSDWSVPMSCQLVTYFGCHSWIEGTLPYYLEDSYCNAALGSSWKYHKQK